MYTSGARHIDEKHSNNLEEGHMFTAAHESSQVYIFSGTSNLFDFLWTKSTTPNLEKYYNFSGTSNSKNFPSTSNLHL